MTQAEVLIQALPYIKRYAGKTVVVKYGGAAMLDEALKAAVMQDIVLMRYVGISPILVHGGGPEISEAMHRLGKEPHFVGGLRVTDAETMEIVEMVLAGKTNKGIVAHAQSSRAHWLLVSQVRTARLIVAERETTKGDIGFVGRITQINPALLHTLVRCRLYSRDFHCCYWCADGESYNVNADTVAGRTGFAALKAATRLIMMTDVEGIYTGLRRQRQPDSRDDRERCPAS